MSTTTATTSSSHAAPRLSDRAAAMAFVTPQRTVQAAADRSGLDPMLMDLVKLRASQLNGCAFCIDMHVRDAKQRGETDERLHLLNAWREVDLYSERERAALTWTEALTRLTGLPISDDIFNEVRAVFSETELIGLTTVIVAINGWNRFKVGFRVPPGAL